VTFEEADEAYFVRYFARNLLVGSEIRANSPAMDWMHQVQCGKLTGPCEYGTQCYCDLVTVTLCTEVTTIIQGRYPYGIEGKLDICIQRRTTTEQHTTFNCI
jgi:hypothetical protein